MTPPCLYFRVLGQSVECKRDFLSSTHSRFGVNMEGNEGEILSFASAKTFLGEIVLVYVHAKKSYCPFYLLIYFVLNMHINSGCFCLTYGILLVAMFLLFSYFIISCSFSQSLHNSETKTV